MKALQHSSVSATFPTSISQKRCWFMEQMHPGNRGLNLAVRWEVRGPATHDLVERAFNRIVARHEVLRTCFVEEAGEPVQQVMERVDFKLGSVDLRTLSVEDRNKRIDQIAIEHSEEPFDLTRPCLLRVTMIQLEPERAALLIAVHNAVFDGFSIGVLGNELGQTLAALAKGTEADLPVLDLQYGDYALWLEEFETSGAMAVEEQYWKNHLDGMPYFELPFDRPRAPGHAETGACGTDLPADFEVRMAAAARQLGTSVFVLGTAAFSIALARFSGKSQVSYAVQVAGRTDIDLEPLIGIFTNPIVLRFDVEDQSSLKAHSAATHDLLNGALAHQTLPFDKLVQVINPPRDPLRIPLVSIMFNLQKAFLKELTYDAFELVSVQSHSPATLYDINVNIVGRNAGWRMVIDYNKALFDAETLREFSDILVDVFDKIVSAPEMMIGDLTGRAAQTPQDDAPVPVDEPAQATGAGQGEMLARIKALWSDVLKLPEDRITGSFFDLGGHSVLALRMLSRVEADFGQRPSIYEFLRDPTAEALADLLTDPDAAQPVVSAPAADQIVPAQGKATRIWELAELRSGSDATPVLLTVNQPFMYQALARGMTQDCVVANVGIPSMAALEMLKDRGFDAAMEQAAALVREKYAGRPVVLCGLCVDGRAALRLAQFLTEGGMQVSAVGMIDTWAPGAVHTLPAFARRRDRWRIKARRLSYYMGLRAKGDIRWRDVFAQNDVAAALLRRFDMIPPKGEEAVLVDATVDRLVAQTRAYEFAPYSGEVALFVTSAQGLTPQDGVLGWSNLLARDVAVHPVKGWHGDALTRSGFGKVIGVLEEKIRRVSNSPPRT